MKENRPQEQQQPLLLLLGKSQENGPIKKFTSEFSIYYLISITFFRDSVLYNVDTGAGAADNERRWPIVYHGNYNILLFGIEKVHPFDSTKWGKVNEILMSKQLSVVVCVCLFLFVV